MSKEITEKQDVGHNAPEETASENHGEMSLYEHLVELRSRLLYGVIILVVACVVCFFFAEQIFLFLAKPLAEVMGTNPRLIATGLTEIFFTWMKIGLFAGAFITSPFLLTQIWLFIAPGLYKKEKRAFLPFLIASPILFFLGGVMVYTLIFPVAWSFLLGFEVPEITAGVAIEVEPKVNEYLTLVMKLFFAFGLCFQVPVLITLLGRVGLVSAESLKDKRKYAILVAFLLAAFLTPPDPLTQIALALPTYGLYELSLWIVHSMERKRDRQAETA